MQRLYKVNPPKHDGIIQKVITAILVKTLIGIEVTCSHIFLSMKTLTTKHCMKHDSKTKGQVCYCNRSSNYV